MALYKDCENCGKEFSYNKSRRPNARFCSRSCLSKVTKKEQDAKRELGWYLDTNEQVLEALKSKHEKFVIKNDECWDWSGSKSFSKSGKFNYGRFRFRGKLMNAHRVSYIIHKGEIPDGLFVCHSCDNPPCSNPEHLFLGTNADNMKDMASKKRAVPRSKLTVLQVRAIRKLIKLEVPNTKIAKKYNVSDVCICYIKQGKTWGDIK